MDKSLIGSGHIAFAHISSRGVGQAALCKAPARLLEAELDLCERQAERLKAFETHLTRVVEGRDISRARVAVGTMMAGDGAEAEFYRLDAEIRLEREKAK